MRVLFDITHPADVHLFKNVIRLLQGAGDQIVVASRSKEVTTDLLASLNIPHECISRLSGGIVSMGAELLQRYARLAMLCRRFKPDVLVARIGLSIGLVGAILRIPRVVIEDTEHAKLQLALSMPFATHICTGTGYLKSYGSRQTCFRGYPVMAYLAPRYFQPSDEPFRTAGLDPAKPYVLLRLVSWQAVHDRGLKGMSDDAILASIEKLSCFGRVLISSERPLPATLQRYQCPVQPNDIHHLLARARIFISEGGTMAAEAAVLGTPSIFCNPLRTGYLLSLEKDYGLVHNVDSIPEGVTLAQRLLAQQNLSEIWQQRRKVMLAASEDVTVFFRRMIEHAARGVAVRRAMDGTGRD